jgi:hypothetical protein
VDRNVKQNNRFQNTEDVVNTPYPSLIKHNHFGSNVKGKIAHMDARSEIVSSKLKCDPLEVHPHSGTFAAKKQREYLISHNLCH